MAKKSAGVVIWKHAGGALKVLLVHPGGPFWMKKDLGAWSIPKGEYDEGESALAVARRELVEELGQAAKALAARPDKAFIPLGDIRQKGGKTVTAFALEGDFDVSALASNSFELEWPPRSGRRATFPEIDRAEWFPVQTAGEKILAAQAGFVTRVAELANRR